MPETAFEELLEREDAMRITKCSWTTIWREVAAGRLKSVRVGARVLFRPRDLRNWIDGRVMTRRPAGRRSKKQ